MSFFFFFNTDVFVDGNPSLVYQFGQLNVDLIIGCLTMAPIT